MACSAFAEAGEPCPIDTGKKSTTAQTAAAKDESILEAVEDTLAGSAFAEEDEPCPENIGEHGK
jgi:hypothetical protein